MTLKRRLIPVMLLKEGRLTKTVSFDSRRDVGDPVKSADVYSSQYADELVFLNIDHASQGVTVLLDFLERISEVCFMPLALGGGITTINDARALIQGGADKVVVNSAVYRNIQLVSDIADSYGSQAVVVSIDCRRETEGGWSCWSSGGRVREEISLSEHLQNVVEAGAGEIFIQSIDADGQMQGLDIELLSFVVKEVSVPVIGCSGAGNYEHLRDAFLNSGVDALAMGSIFNFTDSNPIRAKAFLSNYNLLFKVV